MSRSRLDLARTFLDHCAQDYATGAIEEDIPSHRNVVAGYLSPEEQRKYTHMYFAKSVACWRYTRRILRVPSDGPVVSVGAGPCLCLLGWFWDQAPHPGQEIIAADVLPWESIVGSEPHRDLICDVLGASRRRYWRRYVPDTAIPPQLERLGSLSELQPLSVQQLPTPATVLMPFLLNHLVGRYESFADPSLVFRWMEDVRVRCGRVVVVDMSCAQAGGLWGCISQGLEVEGAPCVHSSSNIEELAGCYRDRAHWPTRRTSSSMQAHTVLLGDSTGWRYVSPMQEQS